MRAGLYARVSREDQVKGHSLDEQLDLMRQFCQERTFTVVAEFVEPGTPEHDHAMSIYAWQSSSVQLGRPLDQPPQIALVRVDPQRIVYTEQWLRKDGYAPRQIWHKDPARKAATRRYGH